MIIEGSVAWSGSGPCTNGSGSGRPKNIRIRIRNTSFGRLEDLESRFFWFGSFLYQYAISHFRCHRLENQRGQFIGTYFSVVFWSQIRWHYFIFYYSSNQTYLTDCIKALLPLDSSVQDIYFFRIRSPELRFTPINYGSTRSESTRSGSTRFGSTDPDSQHSITW